MAEETVLPVRDGNETEPLFYEEAAKRLAEAVRSEGVGERTLNAFKQMFAAYAMRVREVVSDPELREILPGCVALCGSDGFVHGRPRMTHDVDFLVDPSPENVARVREALLALPDGAARDLRPGDLLEYGVVRVADEVVVDLIARIGDVEAGNAGTSRASAWSWPTWRR